MSYPPYNIEKHGEIRDGLFRIEVVREIPEEQKPRTIQIKGGEPQKALEHTSGNKKKVA